jgi:hypothetical protein
MFFLVFSVPWWFKDLFFMSPTAYRMSCLPPTHRLDHRARKAHLEIQDAHPFGLDANAIVPSFLLVQKLANEFIP